MKKVILGLLSLIIAAVVIVCVVAAMQPAQFTVTRSATFNAPPDALYAQVNDFKKWNDWSPWEKVDPNMKKTISEPSSGRGASYAWAGNDEAGEGKMTITDTQPARSVKIDLQFIKPFAMSSVTDFTFKPEGDKTAMTWSMTGDKNFITKVLCLFMDMDKLVGTDFENGMANLKPIVESAPRPTAPIVN